MRTSGRRPEPSRGLGAKPPPVRAQRCLSSMAAFDRPTGPLTQRREGAAQKFIAWYDLLAFGRRYEQIATPFQWKFTRHDLDQLLAKTDTAHPTTLAA